MPALSFSPAQDYYPALDGSNNGSSDPTSSEVSYSFNRHIRPLLDVVDQLRSFGIMAEGINLPSIVVVGDQSSGKSSVLESLAGIALPRGQGIVTRMPLILRLQTSKQPRITVEYEGVNKEISEEQIASTIEYATQILAGSSKGITDKPITVHVSKPNAPDLTMVDLPGITRVPVHGQPQDIYDQVSKIILHYITPEESIILNVLSAAVDFPTCESIRMSREADKKGSRTLAVVTKVDKCPEGLYNKITDNAVSIGLGYVCVRNRTDEDVSFEDARRKEKELFQTHPELSRLDASMVGVSSLADRLMRLQAESIVNLLPKVIAQIDKTLTSKRKELEALGEGVSSGVDAQWGFFKVVTGLRKTMEEILLQGSTDVFPDNPELHYTARLHTLSMEFSEQLKSATRGLMEPEFIDMIKVLIAESQGVNLPNVVPQAVIDKILRHQLDRVTGMCKNLVTEAYELAEKLCFRVTQKHAGQYPYLLMHFNESCERILADCRDNCLKFVDRLLQMQRSVTFTSGSLYMRTVKDLGSKMDLYKQNMQYHKVCNLEGIGNLDLSIIPTEEGVWEAMCNAIAYWVVVEGRLADDIPIEVRFAFNEAMVEGIEKEVAWKVFGCRNNNVRRRRASIISGDIGDADLTSPRNKVVDIENELEMEMEEVMTEDPSVSEKRSCLQHSVDVLSKSRAIVSKHLGRHFLM